MLLDLSDSHPVPDAAPASGARLVATDGRTLPLAGADVSVDASGGVARVVLTQRFRNPHPDPLAVTYSLPLPADGAVSGFSFRVGDVRVTGEVDRRAAARERYEQALIEGRSAALLEQDRSSLFTQEVGNIPPGEDVVAEVVVDQRLVWLDEGAWEWRFPTVAAPRYLGEPGRVEDAARVTQEVADGPLGARVSLRCAIRDALAEGRRPESPSHGVQVEYSKYSTIVTLRQGAALDRDLVVRWAVAAPKVGLSLDTGGGAGEAGAGEAGAAAGGPYRSAAARPPSDRVFGLLTVVPPAPGAAFRPVPRDLVVLLDTSGSMHGEPLDQARHIVMALVGSLSEKDQLELIEFSNAPNRWRPSPVAATASARREALGWLKGLRASGGTEMRTGILEALRSLRPGAQRQVILVTDGLIGFESQVIAAILDGLPASSRLHTVGVGSGVNRALTAPAARAGRGVEVVVGLGEDPERAARRILARTAAPILVELGLSGSALIEHAPARLPDLFAGAPVLVGVALRAEGGELCVRGRTAEGTWEQRLRVAPAEGGLGGTAAAALFGREAVEDLETRLAAGGDRAKIDAEIERLGLGFQIATRLTSWVAVSAKVTVDAASARRHERQPHELPHGMSAEGLGLRPAQVAGGGPEARAVAGDERKESGVLFSLGDLPSLEESRVRAEPAASASMGAPASEAAPAPARASAPVELKARLGKVGASPRPAPSEPQGMPLPMRLEAAEALAPKRSRTAGWIAVLVLIAIVLAVGYAIFRAVVHEEPRGVDGGAAAPGQPAPTST